MKATWLLLSLLALWPSQSPYSSKFEKGHPFRWDQEFRGYVQESYGDERRFYFRLAQVYSESAFDPRATSDYGGWKKAHLDTATAIRKGKGAASLAQFIWGTASRYGATTINPGAATDTTPGTDIYNPYWSLRANTRYMKAIERCLTTTKNPKARRKLMSDKKFLELVACASYNTGEGRLKRLLDRESEWDILKLMILPEPRNYAEKILKVAKEMEAESRWK